MTFPPQLPDFTKLCAIVGGTVGGWTLSGVLSVIASAVAIVVGGLHIYDWIQKKCRNRGD